MGNWWDNLFGAGLGSLFGPILQFMIILIVIGIVCVAGYFVIKYLWHKTETEGEQKQRLEFQQKAFDQALVQTKKLADVQQVAGVSSSSPPPATSQVSTADAAKLAMAVV